MKRTDITAIWPDATDEQIKTIMDINGSDINNAKGHLDELKTQLASANAELEKLKQTPANHEAEERAAALQAELDSIKRADALRVMREKVSSETRVPAALLTGETEEACAEQAKQILAFAQPTGYPTFRDGGEPRNPTQSKTRDKFAEWANQNLG